jgi:hypothetical protein
MRMGMASPPVACAEFLGYGPDGGLIVAWADGTEVASWSG